MNLSTVHDGRYVALEARDQGLEDVSEVVAQFPDVQSVDLSFNAIRDLSPLRRLEQLFRLNVSNNQLTELAGIRRTPEEEEATKLKVGSLLRELTVAHNSIATVHPSVALHIRLTTIDLSYNQLTDISALFQLKALKRLNVAENRIAELPGAAVVANCPRLEDVCLDYNEIRDMSAFNSSRRLMRLSVRGNRIDTLTTVNIPSLKELNLSANHVAQLEQLDLLRDSCPGVVSLNLAENPIAHDHGAHYRAKVLFRLPHLGELDAQAVGYKEKVKACNLYGADLKHREGTFRDAMGEEHREAFQTLLTPFSDARWEAVQHTSKSCVESCLGGALAQDLEAKEA